ncbi:MAG TPA: amino acid ABC transporter ATP-binding protein [Bauldia sp.]|nr:amino acid ABC transporter ATP-binding protein [Bauldia sp.]HVZ15285.1 amino acid ABC transporter ATP-binding protein [Bauldia sp.]
MDKTPIVRVERVEQGYHGVPVLRGVDLTVSAGETLAIIGPSGSGKSTLLRVIAHLVTISAGRVVVDNLEISNPKVDLRRLHQTVGMVFQSYNLFPHMTALRNITLGLTEVLGRPRAEAEEIARKFLRKVRLEGKENAHPDELSGGQQQRVAIARSLALNPKIMLLDEVTAALDPETVKEVLVTIRELAEEGMTLLIVTHEMGFAREVADRVVFMDGGVVIEQGRPEKMFKAAEHARTRAFLEKVL